MDRVGLAGRVGSFGVGSFSSQFASTASHVRFSASSPTTIKVSLSGHVDVASPRPPEHCSSLGLSRLGTHRRYLVAAYVDVGRGHDVELATLQVRC